VDGINEVIAWFTSPEQWSGNNSIPLRLWEHVSLSAAALAAGIAVALPVGLYIGHTGKGARTVIAVANIGRAVPSLGWLGIVYPISVALLARGGLGFWPTFVALVALALPPIVTNTYAGLREVDPDLREAGRGMGMRETELLRRVEIPIALPVILAGVRASAVTVVATATLSSIVGGGTLGAYVVQGLFINDMPRVVGGAIMVAALALLTEWAFATLQRRSVSEGLRGRPMPAPMDLLDPRSTDGDAVAA
jgi:osmoprotectant transport system permease protein